MGLIRNGLTRRFPKIGLLSDLALVGAAVNRAMQRKGGTGAKAGSTAELALAGGAAFRLLRRWRRRRKAKKLAA